MLGGMWLKRHGQPAMTELGLAFVGLLVGWVAVSVLMSLVRDLLSSPEARLAVGLLAGPLITAIAALVYQQIVTRLPREAAPEVPALPQASISRTSVVIVAGLLAALAGSIVLGLIFKAVGLEVQEQKAVTAIVEDARTGGPLVPAIMLCVSATFFAPMAEEWLFRGLLYRRVRAVGGVGLAYAISAVAFAAIHGNPTGLLVYAWLGIVFAVTLQITGRLSAAMAVHLGNNAFVLATLFWGIE